jgi:hypothetical protein
MDINLPRIFNVVALILLLAGAISLYILFHHMEYTNNILTINKYRSISDIEAQGIVETAMYSTIPNSS